MYSPLIGTIVAEHERNMREAADRERLSAVARCYLQARKAAGQRRPV